MSLRRRTRHRSSRNELVREAFYSYFLTLAVVFLYLWFGKHHSRLSSDEPLPMMAAAREAVVWGILGPIFWMLKKYVLEGTELGNSFSSLDWQVQRLVIAGAVVLVFATFVAWRWMLPLWGLAVAVALYLRYTRSSESL